jgi:AcrR family transcriptional regulator
VSRGSFYWHFADLAAFHARVIDEWKRVATEAVIADIERHASTEARLDALLRYAFGSGAVLEVRMRAWAEHNAAAARALAAVDRRRQRYIERMLVAAGIASSSAATRTRVLYWTYLGAALSRSRFTGPQLDEIVTELKRIGLAGSARVYARRREREGGA